MKYPKEYLQFATAYPKSEVVNWALWDTQLYTSAATLALAFFQAVGATLDVSNMEVGGQLPSGKAFLVRAIRFFIKHRPWSVNQAAPAAVQTGSIDDTALLFNNGALQLTIGTKQYGQYPLWAIPAGGGPFGNLGVNNILVGGAMVDYGQAGYPHARNLLTLAEPLFIPPQMNFRCDIFWAAANTLAEGNTNLCVCLEGDLIRLVQ